MQLEVACVVTMVPRCFPSGEKTRTPPGPVAKQITGLIHRHTVGQAGPVSNHGRRIEEQPRLLDGPVLGDRKGHPYCALRIGVGYIERAIVRRKSDPVGTRQFIGQQGYLSATAHRESVDPLMRKFLCRIFHLSLETVRGVGEVQVPIGMEDGVVGTVEAMTLVSVGEREKFRLREVQRRIQSGDTAVPVLAKHQMTARVEQESVGPGFAASGRLSRVPRRTKVQARSLALLPTS